VDSITVSFQLEQEAIKLPLQELTAKIARFEEEMKTIAKDREHNRYLLSGHLKKITSQLDEEIAVFKKEGLPVLHKELEEAYLRRMQSGGGNLRSELEEFVFAKIQERFTGWRQQLVETISLLLEEAHGWFAARTNETIERILALTSDIFELKLKPFTSVETLSRKSDFYFLLKDDPVGLELVQLAATSALPGFISRKIILKKMQETVTELVDRHCGRVRYDLLKRLTTTVHDFQQDLNEKTDLTLEGIRISFQKALAINQCSKVDVDRNLGELSQRLGSILSLRDKLFALNSAFS
jgi:hypothetical protein